ncbi:TM0106 family RecB-like putative nuclease [Sphingomonas sp. TF3]|uniref:TM0106 family RecB-like putative nuclease n=1 Tax=Sphingomonas sp. TF3 TaxID=2495580 RepID=UPI000F878FD6|nr:TM0106 family RecB-like putative nuclease [Sphingomonas sp. TF3]RUN76506.1 TM0106 family RecB-like putative nuclease [Sphingomonas sp. TF3]
MTAAITGTLVRDLLLCERRADLDVNGDASRRDEVSDFVRMLWDQGCVHEDAIVEALPGTVVDLRDLPAGVRFGATLAAMDDRPDWIVGGRLEAGDRVGVPDLLRLDEAGWSVGDVKSGQAFDPAGRPNREYAVQVGHYGALLGELGLGDPDRAFVVGRDGRPVWYDLTAPRGDRPSIADEVDGLVDWARSIVEGTAVTRPALSAACGMCHWRGVCRAELDAASDVTLVAGLGRALRDVVEPLAPTVPMLAALSDAQVRGASVPGLGRSRLLRFRDRARLLSTSGAKPFARAPLGLRRYDRELHLDLESDPMSDGLVYLHGVVVIEDGREEYHAFFAERPEDEGRAFAEAWAFLNSPAGGHVFHYSRFERTSYRVLARRYPEVCTAEEVEALFSRARSTDLLVDAVQPLTEWPTNGVGIKPLAKWLGFNWRDRDASGAASIAWFHEWLEAGSAAVRRRIEEYNHDDCRATAVLLEALIELPVLSEAPWPVAEPAAA